MILDATVGGSSANSYCDSTFADDYFESRVGSDNWTSASDDNKDSALIIATQTLDANYEWNGYRSTDTQALGWPRQFATNPDQRWISLDGQYIDNAIVPTTIKKANCEMAIYILANGGYEGSVNDLRNLQVGPIKLGFNSLSTTYPLPTNVLDLLRKWGRYIGRSGGNQVRTVPLVRT
jgi:hypothetical protein